MAKHRNLSFRPACESKESREGGGPEVVVGETVVNVEAGAGVVGVEPGAKVVGVEAVDGEAGEGVVDVEPGAKVVGVEAVDGEAGAGVVDDAVAAGERSTVVGATVEISSSIFSNLGA